ncbi:MAG: hypothetical protein ACLGI2_00305 [Acidimicrobiia bacterium]
MKSAEHRAVGNEATAGALGDLGRPDRPFFLGYGDVVALSGDYFPAGGLFGLAACPGELGCRPGTRDEVVCALDVMAVDEGTADRRFDRRGEFGAYRLAPEAARDAVERAVRDRFLALAAANADHFVDPWGSGGDSGPGPGPAATAVTAYRRLHEAALDEAVKQGRHGGDLSRALAREAAAQHYLTDAFASGHARTPIAAIRRYWYDRYPRFWESLQRKVASDTAAALRELAPVLRLCSRRMLSRRTLAAVRSRTSSLPPVSLGDLLGRVFHDWDNDHGLRLQDGRMLFGDGHLGEGAGWDLAVAAVRAGNDDVEIAYRLARSRRDLRGEALYGEVREATGGAGVGGRGYRTESFLPRLAPDNAALNWQARDLDELWASPIAGTTGPTVGEAVGAVLEPGGEVIRRLGCLGHGMVDAIDVPVLRGWLAAKACSAYHAGFLAGLARDPRGSVAAVVAGAGGDARADEADRRRLAAGAVAA